MIDIILRIILIIHFQLIKSKSFDDNIQIINNDQQLTLSMLEVQNFEVAPGINYEYIYVKGNSSKGTILFLHGFPSSYNSWRHQIEYFSNEGYDCLAPNMMGYGKTYSPLNTTEYKMKSMVGHLITLLNKFQIDKVIVIGHDWGTRVAGRFVLYCPSRTLGVVLISGAYNPPALFDLDRAIDNSKKALGYETFGHWKFFEANDAAMIIENNLDSFMDLVFANDSALWRTNFVLVGKLRDWLINNNRTNRASYITENDYTILKQYFSEGMQPKLNWFKTIIENNDWEDEKNLDPIIKKPILYIGGTKDYVSVIASYGGTNQFIEDLETIPLNTGHWVMEEDPNSVNQNINKWIHRIISI